MSILICAIVYGGCGYYNEGSKWKSIEPYKDADILVCPECGEDHAVQLTDGNFEEATKGLTEKTKNNLRERLDQENSTIHGEFLKWNIEKGFINKHRLTPAQKEEIQI